METVSYEITVEVEDDATEGDIFRKAHLYASLHGWDNIQSAGERVREWVTDIDPEQADVKNPIYS